MTQAELNRQVARATGESVETIARMGFVLLNDGPVEPEPLDGDCDPLEADRHIRFGHSPVRRHDIKAA
ncbi:MAG: hypothetical protein FJ276_25340 [Planctomycetes bacterium]|nr:hypothetical protein [Planctomycetota bacterium]